MRTRCFKATAFVCGALLAGCFAPPDATSDMAPDASLMDAGPYIDGGMCQDTGGPVPVASQDALAAIASDGINIYWSVYSPNGVIMEQSLSGGTVTTLAENQDLPYQLVVDSQNVYWVNVVDDGSVVQAPIAGEPLSLWRTTSRSRTESLFMGRRCIG